MSKVAAFHSINEANKPAGHRVHHNDDTCGPGKEIPRHWRVSTLRRLCQDKINLL
jgi:hypothetical protein